MRPGVGDQSNVGSVKSYQRFRTHVKDREFKPDVCLLLASRQKSRDNDPVLRFVERFKDGGRRYGGMY